MRRIRFVFPTLWDQRQLEACRAEWATRFLPLLAPAEQEAELRWDFDPDAYVERLVREEGGRLDGVTSSSDYAGAAVAAVVASRLSLPGTPPRTLLLAQNKYAARLRQREFLPDETPRFALLDARRRTPWPRDLFFPCFVKPVRGSFSVCARRIESLHELESFLTSRPAQEFVGYHGRLFDQLQAHYSDCSVDSAHFLAEDLLHGNMVTVEGFARGGMVTVLGVVDALVDARTRSFVRFDYPSRLEMALQTRLEEVTRRTAQALGLREGLFNVELFHDPESDAISIVELNARVAGQFADLHEKVDGTSTYTLMLELAAGETPSWRPRRGRYACAASVPLRIFEPQRVLHAPDPATIQRAERIFEGTLAWSEVATGTELCDFERGEDGASARYAIVNLGAGSASELEARALEVRSALGFRFAPVPAPFQSKA